MTTGVLAHLHETRGWRFHVLTRKAFAPALTGHPAVDKIIMPDEESLHGPGWIRATRTLASQYSGWGLLDLHGTLRSMMLAARWNGPVRRYPKFSLSRRLFGRTRLAMFGDRLAALNVPQRYALAVDDTAPARMDVRPRIHLSHDERTFADDIFIRHGLNAPVAALHPYATHAGKQWPKAHWLRLTQLLREAGWRCIVLGRDPQPLFGDDAPEGVIDFTGKTTIRQTCALLARADVLVTGDSGPMHLGTAVDTRTVALFGPTTEHWGFFPSGEHDIVLQTDLPCRPCSLHGGKGCRLDTRCMRDISPETVAQAVIG
nr:glycosyltransferase family 9 protein [Desulfobaculum xiamenense]